MTVLSTVEREARNRGRWEFLHSAEPTMQHVADAFEAGFDAARDFYGPERVTELEKQRDEAQRRATDARQDHREAEQRERVLLKEQDDLHKQIGLLREALGKIALAAEEMVVKWPGATGQIFELIARKARAALAACEEPDAQTTIGLSPPVWIRPGPYDDNAARTIQEREPPLRRMVSKCCNAYVDVKRGYQCSACEKECSLLLLGRRDNRA
jgi:hypothetical protein